MGWNEAMWYRFQFQARAQLRSCGLRNAHRWGLSSPTVYVSFLRTSLSYGVVLVYKKVHESIDTRFFKNRNAVHAIIPSSPLSPARMGLATL